MSGPEHIELRRDDVPEQLQPLYDTLSFEIRRVREVSIQLHKLRRVTVATTAVTVICSVFSLGYAVNLVLT